MKQQEEEKGVVKIHTSKHIIVLRYGDWDTDISVDDLCKIDYANIFGEMITVSALLNKIGILRADVEEEVKLEKLDQKLFEAQKYNDLSKWMVSQGQKPTSTSVTAEVDIDPDVIAKRKKLIQLEKQLAYVEALYWAIKDKASKLNNILRPVTPEEFQDSILSGTFNTIKITKLKRTIG